MPSSEMLRREEEKTKLEIIARAKARNRVALEELEVSRKEREERHRLEVLSLYQQGITQEEIFRQEAKRLNDEYESLFIQEIEVLKLRPLPNHSITGIYVERPEVEEKGGKVPRTAGSGKKGKGQKEENTIKEGAEEKLLTTSDIRKKVFMGEAPFQALGL